VLDKAVVLLKEELCEGAGATSHLPKADLHPGIRQQSMKAKPGQYNPPLPQYAFVEPQ
jgi:hypothetical protein